MARYKPLDYGQGRFISIRFENQILPGTFEHALSWIVDHKLDLSVFDPLYKNDATGATAYDPRGMLKIVLYAYSRGIVSSRDIERACAENVVMMALSADTRPHFTTIAGFIRDMAPVIQGLFVDALMYCDELGLIGREMFAIDGCKISSNASKEWSGTREDFTRKKAKFEQSIERLIQKHKAMDEAPPGKDEDNDRPGPRPPGMREREEKAIENLKATAARIEGWLKRHPEDKKGYAGKPVKQSMTDPDSAKMVSSHGVIQGFNGVAAVDAKHQVVVSAEAFGTGSEAALLEPMVEKVQETFHALGDGNIYARVKVTADSGFHTEETMKMLERKNVDGYVADKGMRKRDPAFLTSKRHEGKIAGIQGKPVERNYFVPDDFTFNERGKLVCPAGSEMYIGYRKHETPNGFYGVAYKSKITACRGCALRPKCLRNPGTKFRQVYKFEGRRAPEPGAETATQRMIRKIDGAVGRFLYSRRMGIVEPVFGHLRHALGLDRFTLRGKAKVNTQWKLFALVHNLFKIQRVGWAGTG